MIRYIYELSPEDLSGTALVRIDLNAADAWRLEASVPTLKFLMGKASKIVILSHRGRPVLERDKEQLSLRGDAELLSAHLGRSVVFVNTRDLAAAKRIVAGAELHSAFLLENVRFWDGEEENDPALAAQFAALGDYFVNEAFAVSHRANASVTGIPRHIPAYGGLGLRQEIQNLGAMMGTVEHPFVVVLGGAKPDTKLPVLERFRRNADAILVGGALANVLMEQTTPVALPLVLPVDFLGDEGKKLDIGPRSAELFAGHIRNAKTILWNGPMGLIEDERYRGGTETIARAIAANKSAFSIVGGGETVMAIRNIGLQGSFSFVSTGGGAMLEFLGGATLPGIAALEENRP
ncbi:MAG: phosphoglycerate kinase [Candidatus Liptonbacteria bacterium]|nr:phosphoglycerate kinase [Candidatus Liptonbacteria bacterium]